MNAWVVAVDDPRAPDVHRLLQAHRAFAIATTRPENVHALDIDGLLQTDVTLFSLREDGRLLGVAALRRIDTRHMELKSMHTAVAGRRRGVGRTLVEHLVMIARKRGATRLSLETGSQPAFAPARSLFASCGFVVWVPFGDYPAVDTSTFMTMRLDTARERSHRSPDRG